MKRIADDIPLVAIDVSKNTSCARLFLGRGNPVGRVRRFSHDREGLRAIERAVSELRSLSGKEPMVALEATGVYSEPVERYVRSLGIEPLVLPPARTSAVGRALTKEGIKTDARDCLTIAETAYLLDVPGRVSPELKESRRILKDCRAATVAVTRSKCRLRRLLDEVFATAVSGFGDSVYNRGFLNLFARYPHPEEVRRKGVRTLARTMADGTVHRPEYYLGAAERFRRLCAEAYSGVEPDSRASAALSEEAALLAHLMDRASRLHRLVIEAAESRYPDLLSRLVEIPGVGEYTAACILCFCGDLLAELPPKKLISFVGLAPRVSQSGERTGRGLGITRKGDSYLRSLLFVAVRAAVYLGAPGLTQYYQRKISGNGKGGAHSRRSALTAAAAKLLRVMHVLAASGGRYDPTRIA